MGNVVPFPRAPKIPTVATDLVGLLTDVTSSLPELVTAVDNMGRSAESLCQSLHGGLVAMSAVFDQALLLNEAHRQLQLETMAAIDLAASDPDAASERLLQLRAEYARLATPSTLA